MVWAPDSPDLWAPDSDGHLTLRRAVELFLAAKAAEGATAKTLTWYRMTLRRAVTSLGDGRPVDSLDGADLRAWLLELRSTLSLPTSHRRTESWRHSRWRPRIRTITMTKRTLRHGTKPAYRSKPGLDTLANAVKRTLGRRAVTSDWSASLACR